MSNIAEPCEQGDSTLHPNKKRTIGDTHQRTHCSWSETTIDEDRSRRKGTKWMMISLVHLTYCLFFIWMQGWVTLLTWFCNIWHYAHRGLALSIWRFGPLFPIVSFTFYPYLHYGPSRKTTLRPWDLVSASTRFIRTSSVYWLSMGCWQVSIASGDIKGHILPFHSVCLP